MKKNSRIAFILLLVLAVGIMAAYIVQLQQYSDNTIETEEQAAESVDAASGQNADSSQDTLEKSIESTEHLQDRRKKIMDEMVEGGIAERIENPSGEPFVYVMNPFYGLTFEEQASLMNVIWSYYITEDRNAKVVTIYDNGTGQEVGTYSEAGLKMTGE